MQSINLQLISDGLDFNLKWAINTSINDCFQNFETGPVYSFYQKEKKCIFLTRFYIRCDESHDETLSLSLSHSPVLVLDG